VLEGNEVAIEEFGDPASAEHLLSMICEAEVAFIAARSRLL
jgi:hypothetical protein